ncbi:MAG: PKD domain-containing protein, partial [Gemmataceae bacterium]
SEKPVLSEDGSLIAFVSEASNLVLDDTNNAADIFTFELSSSAITRITDATAGGKNKAGASEKPVFSPDGRYIAFESEANDILPGDNNGAKDVFLYDQWTGDIILVSRSLSGGFANGKSDKPVFSPDGRYIAFQSDASNLVAGDTNGQKDVFLFEIDTGIITRVSVTASGVEGNGKSDNAVFSPDSRYVAFQSDASNFATVDNNNASDVFIKDLQTGNLILVSTRGAGRTANAKSEKPIFSPDGSVLAFISLASNLQGVTGDTNARMDLFLYNLSSGTITTVTPGANGHTKGDISFSPDGRYIAFQSDASNLVPGDANNKTDVFLYDRWENTITLVSATSSGASGNGKSEKPVFSPDGRFVAFQSDAFNLVHNDINGKKDVFLYEIATGKVSLVSITPDGYSGNGESKNPSFSPDGNRIAFDSKANDLVDNDFNDDQDVFVRDLERQITILISVNGLGLSGNGKSEKPVFSPAGGYVAFESEASDLIPVDVNGKVKDVFLSNLPEFPDAIIIDEVGLPDGVGDLVHENEPFTLTGSFRNTAGSGSHTVTIDWDDGTPNTVLHLAPGEFTFSAPHVYPDDDPSGTKSDVRAISITITDGDEMEKTIFYFLSVLNLDPIVSVGSNQTIVEGNPVTVTGSFTDPGPLDTHTALWEVLDEEDNIIVTKNFPTATPASDLSFTFTLTEPGTYRARLTVTDDDTGSASKIVVITVLPEGQPTLTTSDLTLSASSIFEGQSVSLSGTFTSTSSTHGHLVIINWGDNSPLTRINLAAGEQFFTAQHGYLDDNPSGTPQDNVTISVTIFDLATNNSTSASKTVLVKNVPPTANAGSDQSVFLGTPVQLQGTFTDPGVLDTHTQTWTIFDNQGHQVASGDGANFTFHPSLPGTYTARFTVVDDDTGVGIDEVTIEVLARPIVAVGADAGGGPHVRVFDALTGALRFSFFAYAPNFTGGVRVAVGDVTGDGVPDIITAPGPGGGPHIKVFDGRTGNVVASFFAYAPNFTGGVHIAVGNFDGDDVLEIVTGAGPGGGPHVRVFKVGGNTVSQLPGPLGSFFAYAPNFTGGVNVAAANFDGLPGDEIITAPASNGGPHVRVFGQNGAVLANFMAYAPTFIGGVHIAAGDIDNDGRAEIITGAGTGGGPHVKVFNGGNAALRASFMAYPTNSSGGVRVGMVDRNGDGRMELVTGRGPEDLPTLRIFDLATLNVLTEFFAFDSSFRGGLWVDGSK